MRNWNSTEQLRTITAALEFIAYLWGIETYTYQKDNDPWYEVYKPAYEELKRIPCSSLRRYVTGL